MSTENQSLHALTKAISKLLRPLVRILLRNGVPYGAFTDMAKNAYIDVAMHEFGVPGKKQTNSRVSTITGISRKEIQRLLSIDSEEEDQDLVMRYNRAARVVYGWVHNPRYTDVTGKTADLPFEGEGASFGALVKAYSGDVPPRAILDELLRVGVVEKTDDGAIRLLSPAYIPTTGASEKLALLGHDVAGLISTMDKNIHGTEVKPLFQRKVYYDNLPEEATETLHKILRDKGQPLLEFLDEWMARHDRDVNPDAGGTGKKAIGIGLYYFEDEMPTNETPAKNAPTKKDSAEKE